MSEKLLTTEEVSRYLNLSEGEIEELVEKGQIPAYKIGGSFLRFKKDQVERFLKRKDRQPEVKSPPYKRQKENKVSSYSFLEKLEDFLYYNDFYILSLILLILTVLAVFEF